VDVADKAVKLSEQAQGEQVLLRVWQKSGPVSGSRYLTVDNLKKK